MPWQQGQRVSARLPKKERDRKSLYRPIAAIAGCFVRSRVLASRTCPCCRWFRDWRLAGARAPLAMPVEAQTTPGEGTTARATKTPGRKQPIEGGNRQDTVLFLSDPEAQELRFQRREPTSLRCVALSRPKPKRTKLCRAAPTGWTVRRVGWDHHRVRQRRAAVPSAQWLAKPLALARQPRAVRASRCRQSAEVPR